MENKIGRIYIVATPIGNLSDITFRAIETLRAVDFIAAEDTRVTIKILNHFDIKTKLISNHEHNENEKAKSIIAKVLSGNNVAVVTDAGTPIISDPGAILVKEAVKNGIEVISIPGACAAINALVVSGLPSDEFHFVGFIPTNNKEKNNLIEKLKNETNTMIFYIPAHGVKKDIKLLIEVFGEDRLASLSREMTKIHEETIRGTLKEINDLIDESKEKGEFVLVVSGISKKELIEDDKNKWLSITILEHVEFYKKQGIKEMDAIKLVAKDRGVAKNVIYKEYVNGKRS